jgi:hypothetical protein
MAPLSKMQNPVVVHNRHPGGAHTTLNGRVSFVGPSPEKTAMLSEVHPRPYQRDGEPGRPTPLFNRDGAPRRSPHHKEYERPRPLSFAPQSYDQTYKQGPRLDTPYVPQAPGVRGVVYTGHYDMPTPVYEPYNHTTKRMGKG